jgi:Phage gp6-like head-tail connector protein
MAFGDLCQLSDIRAWLQTSQQPYPSTDDALLTRLITAASGLITAWLNRPIVSADWQELRDGVGNDTFVFSVQPVSAVLLVVVNNLTIPPVPAVQPAPPGLVAPAISTFP